MVLANPTYVRAIIHASDNPSFQKITGPSI